MARNFNGSTDFLRGSAAIPGTVFTAGFSLVIVLRPTFLSSTVWPFGIGSSTSGNYSIRIEAPGPYVTYREGGSSYSPASNLVVPTNVWSLIAITKPAGTSSPRMHLYRYDTDAWARSTSSSSFATGLASNTSALIGSNPSPSAPFAGDIAACAVFNAALSDTQLDVLPYSLSGWLNGLTEALWVLDQQSTGQNAPDLTGRYGTQAAITGTTVSTASVPILSYGHPILVATHATAAGGSQNGAAALTAGSSLTAAATLQAVGTATLTAASGLTAQAIADRPAATNLTAASGLTAAGTVTKAGAVAMSAGSDLTAG
ncbi:LamG-like jellyroll fold domain-containing protein, partial [Paractinoplanes toevensis]|uniref:LamG-like jellyroll fold domain-containing protein n=1 Tax=Paractinoplanes toevensis TaxID=571911 RepID=UPI001BB38AC9